MKISSLQKLMSAGFALTIAFSTLPALAVPFDAGSNGSNQIAKNTDSDKIKGDRHNGKHKGHKGEFAQKLGLSDEQKTQMKARHEAFKTENAATIASMKAKHEQLKQLRQTAGKDSPEVQALRTQLKTERQAMMAKREASMQGILTPDQMAKFKAMKAERAAQRGNKGNKGGQKRANPSKS